jgi:hypothetical protein
MNKPGVFNPFPDRKEIQQNYVNSLVEQAKSIDLDKVDYSGVDFKPRNEIV